MVMSIEEQERISAGIEVALAADIDAKKTKKGRKKRRNRSGMLTKTPIPVMHGHEFNNLVMHNPLYKNLLITYAKFNFYNGLPVNKQLSLYDIQRIYKQYTIVKKDNLRINVVARTKSEAILFSKTPKREITHIIRTTREGKTFYLKVGVPKC